MESINRVSRRWDSKVGKEKTNDPLEVARKNDYKWLLTMWISLKNLADANILIMYNQRA